MTFVTFTLGTDALSDLLLDGAIGNVGFLERVDFDANVICLLIQKLLVVYLMQLKFDLDIVHVVGVV